MQSVTEADFKIFTLSAIGMSIAVWDVTFFLGVFDTIFFDKIFAIWVASTAALFASVFMPPPDVDLPISWTGRFVLILPTVWILASLIDNVGFSEAMADSLTFWISILIGLLTLPYMLYVAVLMVTPDLVSLRNKALVVALFGIVIFIGAMGFAVGRNNHLFLTCHDFQVSGNDLPEHCRR